MSAAAELRKPACRRSLGSSTADQNNTAELHLAGAPGAPVVEAGESMDALKNQPSRLAFDCQYSLVAQQLLTLCIEQFLHECAHAIHVHRTFVLKQRRGDIVIVVCRSGARCASPRMPISRSRQAGRTCFPGEIPQIETANIE